MEKQNQLGHPPNDTKVTGLVNFGIGLFHFGLSLVPPTYVWMTKALGFEADRDNAVLALRQSLDSQGPKSVEAAMLLVVIYQFFLDAEEEALTLVKSLDADYPNSPVLAYMGAFIKRINGNIDEAISDFELAIKGIAIEQLKITMHYHLAVTYFMKGEYQKATPLIEMFLEKSTIDQFRPYASYLLGVCYWITNTKKEDIVPLFEKIKAAVKPDQAYDLSVARFIPVQPR
jgi:tetratricopeptide (TPR) repeat protein